MWHLRIMLKIMWQDRITNTEVLERSQSTGIEALLIAAQLRWVGHVWRMGDEYRNIFSTVSCGKAGVVVGGKESASNMP